MSKPRLILQCPHCAVRFSSIDYSDPKRALDSHIKSDHMEKR